MAARLRGPLRNPGSLPSRRPQISTLIALPGERGSKYDFLDLFRATGPEHVRQTILAAPPFQPSREEIEKFKERGARKTALDAINQKFPIPPLLMLRLEYRHARSGEIWLHKFAGIEEDKDTGDKSEIWLPICSPISPAARRACAIESALA